MKWTFRKDNLKAFTPRFQAKIYTEAGQVMLSNGPNFFTHFFPGGKGLKMPAMIQTIF